MTPSYEDLAAKFSSIFERIAQGAVERELKRELPFEQVECCEKRDLDRFASRLNSEAAARRFHNSSDS